MAEKTKIEWCDHTWSPWWGCVEVSPACDHCYARTLAHRYRHEVWGKDAPRRELSAAHWNQPLAWNRAAARNGIRWRVFPSMCDPFEHRTNDGGQLERLRAHFWQLIKSTPNLDWLLLTKRPQNISRMYPWHRNAPYGQHAQDPPRNIWMGATVESNAYKHRIETLRNAPAVGRFLSVEPLLEDLGELDLRGIHQVIVGGESGPHARPMHPDWVRSIRDQCVAAGVSFFFKQWGEWLPQGQDGTPGLQAILQASNQPARMGKKASGRLLDGRTWDELPEVPRD